MTDPEPPFPIVYSVLRVAAIVLAAALFVLAASGLLDALTPPPY